MNDAWIVWTALGLGAGFVAAAFVVAGARRRLVRVAGVTIVTAASAWLVGIAAIEADIGDADGFVDCRDTCSAVQYTAAIAFLGGPLFFALGAAGLLVGILQLRRRRDGR